MKKRERFCLTHGETRSGGLKVAHQIRSFGINNENVSIANRSTRGSMRSKDSLFMQELIDSVSMLQSRSREKRWQADQCNSHPIAKGRVFGQVRNIERLRSHKSKDHCKRSVLSERVEQAGRKIRRKFSYVTF
jgi:hypothetical protein